MVATYHWARVPGQDRAVAQLQRAASRPVHAYLLVGPRGSGVEEAARCFAAVSLLTFIPHLPAIHTGAARGAPLTIFMTHIINLLLMMSIIYNQPREDCHVCRPVCPPP